MSDETRDGLGEQDRSCAPDAVGYAPRSDPSSAATVSESQAERLTGRTRDVARDGPQPAFGEGSELCGGRFAVLRRLGEGGMGVVFEALDREREQRVALKTLSRVDAAGIYRLKSEFRALAGVVHSSLVGLYELFNDEERWFFTMELVDGVPFTDHVRPEGRLDEPALRVTLAHLCRAVDALHGAGKLHRDLKPTNVLVRKNGSVVILDFGLCSDSAPRDDDNALRTLDDAVAGTPLYMAPEQARGEGAGEASDWYAVGVMLYEALCGTPPHTGPLPRVLARKLANDPEPPEARVPGVAADLSKLCMELLQRDPARRPHSPTILARLPLRPSSAPPANPSLPAPDSLPPGPFVGRESELDELRAARRRAMRGASVVVHVHGESGIGKSALVRRFLTDLGTREALVLAGRCYERESMPYKAFDQVFDALSHHLRQQRPDELAALMPRDPQALATVFPVLRRVGAVADAPIRPQRSAEAAELRRRGFAAVRELLQRLARRRPLIVHIDDLQWGDADSELLFSELLRLPDAPAALFICSYRTQPRDAPLAQFFAAIAARRGPAGERIDLHEIALRPLPEPEAVQLARSLVGGGIEDEVASAIVQESAGNPFLLGELAHYGREHLGEGALTLQARLAQRLAALPGGARRLAEVVAVAGRPLAPELAAQAAGVDRNGQDLPRLVAERVVRSAPGGGGRIECYHDRIRETIAASLAAEATRALHAALAEALAASDAADPERMAHHLLAAGDDARGAEYATQAARAAFGALAFLDAAGLYQLALERGRHSVERRRELHAALGEAYAAAGRGPLAAQAFLHAASGAERARALELRRRAAELLLTSGHMDAGVEIIRSVLASIDITLPRSPRVALMRLLLRRAELRMRGVAFEERSADQLGEDELLRIDACWSVAVGLSFVHPLRASEFQARHLLLALRAGEPYRIACGLAVEAGFTALPGRSAEPRAEQLSRAALELARRIRHPHAIGVATFTEGMRHFLVGRWKRSHELLCEAERILIELPGVPWELHSSQRFLINCNAFMGDIPSIAERAGELVAEARERGNLYAEMNFGVRLTSLVWMARDDVEGGIAQTRELMQRWSQEGFHLQHYNELLALASYELYRGRPAAAFARVERTWPTLDRSLLLRTQILRGEAVFLRARCALAHALANPRDGRAGRLAAAGLRQLRREQLPSIDAMADLLEAALCVQRGDASAGLHAYRRAAEHCAQTDMALLAAVARHRQGALLGGDVGAGLIREAEAFMVSVGIRRPAAFLQLFAPAR